MSYYVRENGKLPAEWNKPKLTYAEAVRVSNAIRIQDECVLPTVKSPPININRQAHSKETILFHEQLIVFK